MTEEFDYEQLSSWPLSCSVCSGSFSARRGPDICKGLLQKQWNVRCTSLQKLT